MALPGRKSGEKRGRLRETERWSEVEEGGSGEMGSEEMEREEKGRRKGQEMRRRGIVCEKFLMM